MKILVPVKSVLDYQARIRARSDGSAIESEGIKWIVNPFDEIAVEEAVRLKESGKATEVLVVSLGKADAQAQLRYAMAMGADRAILVNCDSCADVDSYMAACVLAKIFSKENCNLAIFGKQSIDSDANQSAQMMAARLNLPQACFVSQLSFENYQGKEHLLATREVDGGLETVRLPLPCVISTDLRLNQPRYASLPNVMKAKKKPLEEISLQSMGFAADFGPRVKVLRYANPPQRKAGRKVENVAALLNALKEEAKVL